MVLTAEIGGGVTTQMLEEYPWMYSFAVSADISEFPYNPEILPYLPQINKTVIDHLEKVLFADAPVKETMEACQDEIDAVTGG